MNNATASILSFGQVQRPVSARQIPSEIMGALDVKMPIQDFLEYEKNLRWRGYRDTALALIGGIGIGISGVLLAQYYKKKKKGSSSWWE